MNSTNLFGDQPSDLHHQQLKKTVTAINPVDMNWHLGPSHHPPQVLSELSHHPPQVLSGPSHHPPQVLSGPSHHPPQVLGGPSHHPPQVLSGPSHHPPQVLSELSHHPPQVLNGPSHHPPQVFSGPSHHHPPQVLSGPSHHPPQVLNGPSHHPPQVFNGPSRHPPQVLSGPSHHDPPQVLNGPSRHPPQVLSGPSHHYPPQVLNGPSHHPPQVLSGLSHHYPPQVLSGPSHHPPQVFSGPSHHPPQVPYFQGFNFPTSTVAHPNKKVWPHQLSFSDHDASLLDCQLTLSEHNTGTTMSHVKNTSIPSFVSETSDESCDSFLTTPFSIGAHTMRTPSRAPVRSLDLFDSPVSGPSLQTHDRALALHSTHPPPPPPSSSPPPPKSVPLPCTISSAQDLKYFHFNQQQQKLVPSVRGPPLWDLADAPQGKAARMRTGPNNHSGHKVVQQFVTGHNEFISTLFLKSPDVQVLPGNCTMSPLGGT